MENPIILEKIDGEEHVRIGLALEEVVTDHDGGEYKFEDSVEVGCVLYRSKFFTEPSIMFGVFDTWPKVFYPKGIKHKDHGIWEELPWKLPRGATQSTCSGQMHLTQLQVQRLLPLLTHFAEHGKLPKGEGDEEVADGA